MLNKELTSIIEEIEKDYFENLLENEFYVEEKNEKIYFGQKKERKKRYEFSLEYNEACRVIYFENNIKNNINETKKYILFHGLVKALSERKIDYFVATETENTHYFENKKIKLAATNEQTMNTIREIENWLKEDEIIFYEKTEKKLKILKKNNEVQLIQIKFNDIEKKHAVFLKNKNKVIYKGKEYIKKELNQSMKKTIEETVKTPIKNDEICENGKCIPVFMIENNKKNKIIIGKDLFDIEEVGEIIKKIKTERMGFYI